MQRMITELRETLEEFIEQPEDCLLVLGAGNAEVPYVLKTLEQLRGLGAGDIYFSHAEPFENETSWALGFVRSLRQHFEHANHERASRALPPLAAPPDALESPSMSPRDRIVGTLGHLQQWLHQPDVHRVVLALLPARIADVAAYARFAGSFARMAHDEPWMRSGRLLVRDDRRARPLMRALGARRARGVLSYDLDFSIDALSADLAASAVDPAQPLAARMQATLQLAAIDMSWKRHEEAIAKYAGLYEYYGASGAPLMQAMCLLGVGDCLRMAGAVDHALARYQQGLAIAMQARPPGFSGAETGRAAMHPSAPPILLNLTLAAGEAASTLGRYAAARAFFDTASRMAAAAVNIGAATQALERRGDAERALSLFAEAVKTWTDAEKIAAAAGDGGRRASVIERLERLYREARMTREADRYAAQLTRLRAGSA
ncbi:MAG: hypothetical protein M3Y87_01675 [Myxococcota bacterium]|nr:hypothetical protein [Myxococcota bacterium]